MNKQDNTQIGSLKNVGSRFVRVNEIQEQDSGIKSRFL